MEGRKDFAKHSLETNLPQKSLMHKALCDAVRDVHHTPPFGKELSSILVESKSNLLESSIIEILAQSPLTSAQTFVGCLR